jgi:ABC-type glycerol-3-phosphate transport system substrate-binding protein
VSSTHTRASFFKVLVLLGVLALLLTLAACAPAPAEPTQAPPPTQAPAEQPTEAPEPTEAPAAKPVDIRVTGIPGPSGKNIKYCADLFMKENPNIKIEIDIAGGAETEYKPSFPQIAISSDRPDAAWYWVDGRQYQDLVAAGALESLNDVWEQDGLYDAYPAATVQKYTSPDGNQYAGNLDMVWYAPLYYNKAIFAEAGVEPPANGFYYESLDEWYEVIDKIRAAGYEPVTVGGGEGWRLGHLHDQILQRMVPPELMSDFYNNWRPGWEPKAHYNGPEWQAADKMMKEWYDRGVFAEGDLGRNYAEGRALFTQGKAAMYQDGSWAVGILRDEAPDLDFGWMIYPQIDPDIEAGILVYAGSGIMAPKALSPERVAAAKEYIAYCLSKEYQAAMAENTELGLMPGRTDVPEEALKNNDAMVIDMFTKLNNPLVTAAGWDDPAPADMAELSFTLMQEILTGQIQPEEMGEQLEQLAEKHRSK